MSPELHPRDGDIDARVRTVLESRPQGVRVVAVIGVAYVVFSVVLVAVGLLLVDLGGPGDWVEGADEAITEWFVARRSGPADSVAANLTSLADTYTVLGTSCGVVAVLLALRQWRQVTVLLVAVPLELAVFLTVAFVVDRPRPDVEPLGVLPPTASFPSGHIAAAVALYGALAVIVRSVSVSARVNRAAPLVAGALGLGVGVARVHEGLHHTSDVVAGALLGVAALAAGVMAARTVEEEPDEVGQTSR